jgi:hypothetical protein
MDCEENRKQDIAAKPESGVRDPKGKQKLLDKTPHGRHRPPNPNTEDELDDLKGNAASQEKVRVEQLGEGYRANTN